MKLVGFVGLILFEAVIFCEEIRDKKHLRFVVISLAPFTKVSFFPNGSFEFAGTAPEIIIWLSAKMNFSYSFILPTKEEIMARGNEIIVDYLATGRADVGGNSLGLTPGRIMLLDAATFPTWEEAYRMVIPRPSEKKRMLAFIDPFDGTIWLLLLTSFLLVSIFMSLLTYWASTTSSNDRNSHGKGASRLCYLLGKHLIYNVSVLTNQGDYLTQTKASILTAVGCWLLGAAVLVYGYSSVLVSSITIPKQMPSINTLEDVLSHPDISLIIRTDTYIGDAINISTGVPLYRALREKAQRNPESIGIEGRINVTKLLLTGKYAYPYFDSVVRYMIATEYAREKTCRYKLSNRLTFSNTFLYYLFPKGNKDLARKFTIGLMHFSETGLLRQIVKTLPWIPKSDECFVDASKKKAKVTSIKLIDLTSAFFILGIGVTLSLISYLVELHYSRAIGASDQPRNAEL